MSTMLSIRFERRAEVGLGLRDVEGEALVAPGPLRVGEQVEGRRGLELPGGEREVVVLAGPECGSVDEAPARRAAPGGGLSSDELVHAPAITATTRTPTQVRYVSVCAQAQRRWGPAR